MDEGAEFPVTTWIRLDSRRNDGCRIRSANSTAIGGTELREGDAVTVSYTNRDGKIIAQNVKANAR